MKISIIAAIAQNDAIGKNNDLMWHLPKDMQFFKRMTEGHHILTGRKNYFSIPQKYRPLVNRTNLIVTRNNNIQAEGAHVFSSINEAIKYAYEHEENELFVIGGGEIYKHTLPMADKLYITEVKQAFPDADVYFPRINYDDWKEVYREEHKKDDKHECDFNIVIYERRTAK